MISPLVNSTVWGAELGLITLGFSLSYAVLRFASFAHVEFVTVGAYFGLVATKEWSLPLPLAALVAMVGTGIVAVIVDLLIFRRLQMSSTAAKMLASIGVAITIRSIMQLLFGAGARFMTESSTLAFELGDTRVTQAQLMIVVLAGVTMAGFALLVQYTKFGKVLRATADDFALAQARGINGPLVMSWTWFVSGALAALGGVLLGAETFVRPTLGLTIILPMFAAAVLGGLGSAYGAMIGAFLLALAQNLVIATDFGSLLGSASWFVDTRYKSAVALGVLVIVVLVRPRGILARGLE